MDNRSVENTRKLLTEELDAIHQQIQELNRLQKNVEERLQTLSGAEDQTLLKIRLQTFPDRYCHTLNTPYHTDEEMDLLVKQLLNQKIRRIFILSATITLAHSFRLRKSITGSMKIIPVYLSSIITESIVSVAALILHSPTQGITVRMLLIFPELLTYAARHGLVPDGPLLELIWVDNHQSADISEHITELQLRVYPKD